MAKNQEVSIVKKDDNVPAYLQNMERATPNEDNFDSSDVVVPRIKLLQALSPEVEAFDTAKTGVFWHTTMDLPIGTEFTFIVCARRKKLMLVAPLEDGQGILARADDFTTWDQTGKWRVKLKGIKDPVDWEIKDTNVERSGLANWGTSNPNDKDSPPAATMFYEYLVILPDFPDLSPAVVSLVRSQIKKAKKGLNDKIQMLGQVGRPMQALRFKAKVVEDKSDAGPFKNWQFTADGFATEDQYNTAYEMRGLLSTVIIHDEGKVVGEEVGEQGEKFKGDRGGI